MGTGGAAWEAMGQTGRAGRSVCAPGARGSAWDRWMHGWAEEKGGLVAQPTEVARGPPQGRRRTQYPRPLNDVALTMRVPYRPVCQK